MNKKQQQVEYVKSRLMGDELIPNDDTSDITWDVISVGVLAAIGVGFLLILPWVFNIMGKVLSWYGAYFHRVIS